MSAHELIVVAGPRAIGKTFWMNEAIREWPELRRIRTTTTRPRRPDEPGDAYHFVSEGEFQQRLDAGEFLEHDTYRGARYASSLATIENVLRTANGIVALTPPGVAAIWERRDHINIRVVRFVPSDTDVMALNLDRRGITEASQREALISHALAFELIPHVRARIVSVTGHYDTDWPHIRAALMPRAEAIPGMFLP